MDVALINPRIYAELRAEMLRRQKRQGGLIGRQDLIADEIARRAEFAMFMFSQSLRAAG